MSPYVSTVRLKFEIFLTKLLLVKINFYQNYNFDIKSGYNLYFQKIKLYNVGIKAYRASKFGLKMAEFFFG